MLCRCEDSPSGSSSWPRCRQVFANIRTAAPSRTSSAATSPTATARWVSPPPSSAGRQQVGDATQAGPAARRTGAAAPRPAPRGRCRRPPAACAAGAPSGGAAARTVSIGSTCASLIDGPPAGWLLCCGSWVIAGDAARPPHGRGAARGDPHRHHRAPRPRRPRGDPGGGRRRRAGRQPGPGLLPLRHQGRARRRRVRARRRPRPRPARPGRPRRTPTRWTGCAGCCGSTAPPGRRPAGGCGSTPGRWPSASRRSAGCCAGWTSAGAPCCARWSTTASRRARSGCPDPAASVARVSALLDGLSVAALVYRTVSRAQLREWVAAAVAQELGLESRSSHTSQCGLVGRVGERRGGPSGRASGRSTYARRRPGRPAAGRTWART